MAAPKRAVIIGVNEYKDEKIPNLTGACNDAREVHEKLTKFGDFEVDEKLHFLLDRHATCEAIRKAISDLLWKADHHTISLLYFSGHGFQDKYANGYIAPHDILHDEPLVCGIRMQELKELFLAAKNKDSILLILDCCYSGIATEGAGDKSFPVVEPPVDECFSTLKGEGKIILASSGKDQKSREKRNCTHKIGNEPPHDHGAFTYYLLEGLDGQAADKTGKVSLDGLHKFVGARMAAEKDHKLSFYGASVSQAENVIIAEASELHRINEVLKKVTENYEKDKPLLLFDAIDELGDVFKKAPELEVADELKVKVNERLRQYGQSANLWLLQNKREVARELPEVFSNLQILAANFSFDYIVKLSDLDKTLLINLCEVSLNLLEVKSFLSQLRVTSQIGKPIVERSPKTRQGQA